MSIAHDFDPWVHPMIGRGAHGRSQVAEGAAAGPSAEFSFWDLLDVVNPLQHIPIVSSIYRKLTGDEISAHARIMGATLYGGPVGFVVATNLAVVEEAAGERVEDMVADALFGEPETEALADAGAARPAGGATAPAAALAEVPAIEPEGPAEPSAEAPGAAREPAATAGPVPEMAQSLPVSPAAEGTVLTGEDALRAFAADMRSLGNGALAPMPAPRDPVVPAAPAAVSEPKDAGSGASPQAQAEFSSKMMEGLRKYDLMSRTAGHAYGTRTPVLSDSL